MTLTGTCDAIEIDLNDMMKMAEFVKNPEEIEDTIEKIR